MLRLLLLAVALMFSVPAKAEPRTALVIGNAAYAYAPLANSVNDAADMAAALEADGFEVILKTDIDQPGMDAAIAEFGDRLKNKGGVGLFYFSGHGIQVGGENYILPIGEAPARETDVKYKAVNAAQIVDAMGSSALNIIVLDSCRNNPLGSGTRSASRGLARVDGGSGMFVSFATSPGAVAQDGDGRNSPYTKHLVAALRTPGLTLEETFKRTLKGVYQETNGQQTPWISSSFFGDFVFKTDGGGAVAVAEPVTPATSEPTPAMQAAKPQQVASLANPRQVPGPPPAPAGIYRVAGVNPNGSRYAGMVAVTPDAGGYRFVWWIGRQVFTGTGRYAGRMLVVDWGDSKPVIYSFGDSGRLDGEWADGSATETLSLYGEAATMPVDPSGRYSVKGRNPDGSRYTGIATLTARGNGYAMRWKVGNSTYDGNGVLSGNVLTVDWGAATPVVYAINEEGGMVGLWNAGQAEEVLTPAN